MLVSWFYAEESWAVSVGGLLLGAMVGFFVFLCFFGPRFVEP